jgi:phytoene dehydrogenase-like protein
VGFQATMGAAAPLGSATLRARRWDAVVVGAGHNGLTAAAYLAGTGHRVLVLEARDRVGGACTLQQPFSDRRYLVSPCAYAVGLLHPLVVDELDLRRHGYAVHLVDPHLWCPFEDGRALTLWDDDDRSAAEVARLAPGDAEGLLRYQALFGRARRLLRSPERDTWLGDAPGRDELESLLGHDPELIDLVFTASIADVVERHVTDERLRTALHGQGLTGTWAGPRDPGTAAVRLMHSSGSLEGKGGAWGYVQGGMGRISFALADAAAERGAVIATGTGVASILPGEGVTLADGTRILARAVISNADPRSTLALCGSGVPAPFEQRVRAWQMEGPVVKVNCALAGLPRFAAARPGDAPHRAMVTISGGIDATQQAYLRSRDGHPAPEWCELYFHTAYDTSVAPPGKHIMSVFAQYAPYTLAQGTWDGRREQIGDMVIAAIERFAPGLASLIEERQVLGPPDIEQNAGLSGGHIFQGECLPGQMWKERFAPRTPIAGVYLCGAATHPGGSVIAANGRNAAMAVAADLAGGQGQSLGGLT